MIFNLYKKYEEVIKYLIFGVLTTFVSIASYALFTRLAHIDIYVSNVLSWIVAVTFAFITNKIYVFKSSGKAFNEVFKFYTSRLVSLGIELIMMYILVNVIHINDMISKVIVQFIVIVLNYIFSKIFVFKKI